MAIQAPYMSESNRSHQQQRYGDRSNVVCYHWKAGRCNRQPCHFLHSELPKSLLHGSSAAPTKRPQHQNPNDGPSVHRRGLVWRNPNPSSVPPSKWGRSRRASSPSAATASTTAVSAATTTSTSTTAISAATTTSTTAVSAATTTITATTTAVSAVTATTAAAAGPRQLANDICDHFIAGDCRFGERCKFLHSWFQSDSISLLTPLRGHQKGVTGIALPSGSEKLLSGSKDETVRVWDCHTGQCVDTVNIGGEVGCLLSEGPWVFFGIPNAVKAFNTQSLTNLSLDGPTGQVYALEFGLEMLFAGVQDGQILVWKFIVEQNCFHPAASLTGHQSGVVSLIVGGERLFSGSVDCTIRVWDLTTLQCLQTLTDHTSVVMSLLCWNEYLFSCSLDKTIKVWAATESGSIEVTHTHNEEHGVLKLCGMPDAQSKPVLFSACNDDCIRLYDLPSFKERGKIYSKEEVRAIEMGPGGLFFTGDGTGELKVWKWVDNHQAPSAFS